MGDSNQLLATPSSEEVVNISALNQYAYCARRCGLIYLEGEFEHNVHTARGAAEHERVDRVAHEALGTGARVEYALPVWSDGLGLIGKCDVVEFWPDGTVYPVEYKHGPRRKWLNDDLQLAGQALCLEHMTGMSVRRGAIFHRGSRRRREVAIDESLRRQVAEALLAIRAMLREEVLPPPRNDRRCGECSLRDVCQPNALASGSKLATLSASLFDADSARE